MSAPEPPVRLRVGVVGAGVAGMVLAAAWQRAGHRVVALDVAGVGADATAPMPLTGIPRRPAAQVARAADLVLLALPSDEVGRVVADLAAHGGFHPGQIVVHTSAGLGIGVLEPAAASDVLPLALHPALALSGSAADVDRLGGAVVAVTTLRALRPLGEALVVEVGAEPWWVEEEDRPAYAASLAAVREGMQGVLGAAGRVLGDCGADRPDRVLVPLALSVLDGLSGRGSVARDRRTRVDEDQEPA